MTKEIEYVFGPPAAVESAAAFKIEEAPLFYDIYRTEPLEKNRMKFGRRVSIPMRNNADIRDYIVTFDRRSVPSEILSETAAPFSIWIERAPREATFYFFRLLSCDKSDDREFLIDNGYVKTRNKMACTWDGALIVQDNADYARSLSPERLAYNASEYGMSVDHYMAMVLHNAREKMRGYLESLAPGEHLGRIRR